MPEELLTKAETAKWARVSQKQIDILAREKRFPAPIRIGTRPRWRKSDLEAFAKAESAEGQVK